MPVCHSFGNLVHFFPFWYVLSKKYGNPAPVSMQGDQIGRIFAYWVVVLFEQFFLKITGVAQIFHGTNYALISAKKVQPHFRRIFHKLIWSPCIRPFECYSIRVTRFAPLANF
jgi:hypothetical protein